METKSGLPIQVFEAEVRGRRQRFALEHPLLIRVTHWLNAVVLLILIGSGLEIFAAFPSFGDKIPERELINVPHAIRLGDWLGGALQWHLTFMWLFLGAAVAYAIYQAVSGHWKQTLFRPRDMKGVWPMVRHYAFFGPTPPQTEPYNPLQKLAYTVTLASAAAAAVTGWMLFKPVQLGWAVQLCGGFGVVRLAHFLAMCGLLSFIPGHLLMVALHGWNNFRSMLTGCKRDPEYL
jgi:Ni/Fe-hydrogenase b-type cytochrome subunit